MDGNLYGCMYFLKFHLCKYSCRISHIRLMSVSHSHLYCSGEKQEEQLALSLRCKALAPMMRPFFFLSDTHLQSQVS